jgi:hypothetical protein
MERKEVGGASSMYGGEVYTGFWWENLRERDHLEGPGVDGDNIKMELQELEWGHGLNRSGSE